MKRIAPMLRYVRNVGAGNDLTVINRIEARLLSQTQKVRFSLSGGYKRTFVVLMQDLVVRWQ
jgi:hypothetical protein